jgi:hypothetical protein
MDLFLNLLEKHDGLIGGLVGALMGSISTLIVSHWLKNSGKVTINVVDYSIKHFVSDGGGGLKEVDSIKEDGTSKVSIIIDIYNKSESTKTLKNIKYQLLDENNDVMHEEVFRDSSTRKFIGGANRYDDFEYINCNPKELIRKELITNYPPDKILLLRISKKLALLFENTERVNFKSKIIKKVIDLN